MRIEKGNWRVTRNCCAIGNCGTCRGVTPHGTPMRITQGDGYSEAYARWVANNWRGYKAEAEPSTTERREA